MKGNTIMTFKTYSKKCMNIKPILIACSMTLTCNLANADTLQEIYDLALRNDPQLKADIAAYEAGLENKKLGLSNLLPTISGTATYGDRNTETTSEGQQFTDGGIPIPGATDSSTTEQDTTSTGYEISLTQPLFNMPAWYRFKQGSLGTEQAEVQFKADQQTFIIRVATAYFDVLSAIDSLESSIAERTALESQLEQTRQRFEVGLTAITDVYEAQAQFDTVNANTLLAQGELGIAFEALEVLTGQPHQSIAPIASGFTPTSPTPANRADWVDFAMKNNYALEVSRLSAETSRLTAKSSKSAHLPTLGLSASYSSSDSETSIPGTSLIPSERLTDTTSIGIRLSVPIYSGGGTSAQRRQDFQRSLQAQELYNNTQRQTIQQARSLYLIVETTAAQVRAREQAIVSNQSALEATQAGYEVGTRNLVDVLLAQRALYQAQRNYSTSVYDYILSTLRLKEAAGLLSPSEIESLNQFLDSVNQADRSTYQQ